MFVARNTNFNDWVAMKSSGLVPGKLLSKFAQLVQHNNRYVLNGVNFESTESSVTTQCEVTTRKSVKLI